MSIKIEKRGRRYYLIGNTFPIKHRLRDANCNWDASCKAWWTGKKEIAERFAESTASEDRDGPTVRSDQPLLGKVKYVARSGKEGTWFVAASAASGRLLLTNLTADIAFWAASDRCTWVKRYREPDSRYRGTTLDSIRKFVDEVKEARYRGESVEEMQERKRIERAERTGVCAAPGCSQAPAPGKSGYCDRCFFDEYDF